MRRLVRLAGLLPLLALIAVPSQARAAWPAAGDTIYGHSHASSNWQLAPDGSGGVLGWWGTYGGGGPSIVRGVRVLSDGTVPLAWNPNSDPLSATHAAPDGLGGLFKTWVQHPSNYQVYVHHVAAAGGVDPSWPGAGVLVTSSSTSFPQLPVEANDGSGGVFVAYTPFVAGGFSVVVKRVLANGSLAAGWPSGGAALSDNFTQVFGQPLAAPDHSGGAYLAWPTFSSGVNFVTANRVTGGGALAGGWYPGAVAFTGDGAGSNFALVGLAASDSDAYLCWTDQSGVPRVWLGRFMSDGSVPVAWPAGGLLLAQGSLSGVTMTPDGLGGAEVAWSDGATARGVRVLVDGSIAPGWSASGEPLLDASASFQGALAIAPGASGGMVVSWSDGRHGLPAAIRTRWLLADGTRDPDTPDSGQVAGLGGGLFGAVAKAAMSDGAGGAYVGWENNLDGVNYWSMVSWVHKPAVTAAPLRRIPPQLALAAPTPNPARSAITLRFALPSDAPARLDLLDVAGRRVRSTKVIGAGEHVERFDGLAELAPGVYLVRLAQGASARMTRVALLK